MPRARVDRLRLVRLRRSGVAAAVRSRWIPRRAIVTRDATLGLEVARLVLLVALAALGITVMLPTLLDLAAAAFP